MEALPKEKVAFNDVRVRPDGATSLRVAFHAPQGTGVNEEAPFRLRWRESDGLVGKPIDAKSMGRAVKDGFAIAITSKPGATKGKIVGQIDLVICDVATHAICVPVRRALELDLVMTSDAPVDPHVTFELPEAKTP